MHDILVLWLSLLVVVPPAVLFAVLGGTSLLSIRLPEITIGRCVQTCVITGLSASLGMLALMLTFGTRMEALTPGNWVDIPHYHFMLKFEFDRLSIPFAILTFGLCGTVGAFAHRYMHREPGYARFFCLYSLFMFGMIVATLAGSIETLFIGWEMVGLSSAMLVAFFHERLGPARNGLRVWGVYRLSDAALLLASIVLHHVVGSGDFSHILENRSWPDGHAAGVITPHLALLVGLLLLLSAAGKSALVPFSGWLPRAMEGPTPSSAVFYGALSVHLGAFLLLRFSPLLDISPPLAVCTVVVGLLTTVIASVAGRVQSDIKSALSFASMAQVGLIVVEIGLGLRYLALVHILGHACYRTLQFLRAPTLLYDYSLIENAMGQRVRNATTSDDMAGGTLTSGWSMWLYRFGLERGYLDAILDVYLVNPLLALFLRCDGWERRWTALLSGGTTRRPRVNSTSGPEDFQ
jgi:NADH-quinone oxidoreductase subunit L